MYLMNTDIKIGEYELDGIAKKIAIFLFTPFMLVSVICLVPGTMLACVVGSIDYFIKSRKVL